jgi:hypothetical protein
MSLDRRVDLNLAMPDLAAQSRGSDARDAFPRRDAPDPEAKDRFAAALAGDVRKEETPASAPPSAVFGPAVRALSGTSGAATSRRGELAAAVSGAVERLMVGDGSSGNRQVRIEIKDEVLPGVSVAVQELDGRLQVDFVCCDENSRLRLSRALPESAATLAQRLKRDVLIRVQTDDEEDPCLEEALACA